MRSCSTGGKWPKAVAKIVDELDALLASYDFPAEHWIHLKSTNPIESARGLLCGAENVMMLIPRA